MNRDYYKILLVGTTGGGKTYSFRNMNPNTTGFINVENKPLPFKNTFKYHKRCDTYVEVLETIREYAKNPEITSIVIDSFSAYAELLRAEARRTKKGFDVWNMYNEEIGRFNAYVKKCEKEVFITAHYEYVGVDGNLEKRVKVSAKEWEGTFERDYTVVLYADKRFNDKGKAVYSYNLVEENSSAKCPPDIFGPDVTSIPNDCQGIFEAVNQFATV